MKLLLDRVKYDNHNWLICGDLKIIGILRGLQPGARIKYPCFLCLFDSRADRDEIFSKNIWPPRSKTNFSEFNAIKRPLIADESKILLPPLHLKIGLATQFLKRIDEDIDAFDILTEMFRYKSKSKLKDGILDGSEIRKLMANDDFTNSLPRELRAAWNSFKDLVENFLGNHKSPNYQQVVNKLIKSYEQIGANMTVKLHFFKCHLDFFDDGCLGRVSDEQGERFHKEIAIAQSRFKGRSTDAKMLADYCWLIANETNHSNIRRKIRLRKRFDQ